MKPVRLALGAGAMVAVVMLAVAGTGGFNHRATVQSVKLACAKSGDPGDCETREVGRLVEIRTAEIHAEQDRLAGN